MKKLLVGLLFVFIITLSACDTLKETYTVTFVYSETESETVDVLEGSTVLEPNQPEEAGMIFEGWYSDSSKNVLYDFSKPVAGNLRLYAGFEPDVFTLAIYVEGVLQVSEVEYGKELSLIASFNTLQNDGYRFYYDEAFTQMFIERVMPPHDVLLYIKKDIPTTTIFFEENEGSLVEDLVLEEGTDIPNLPIPTLEGYQFVGWVDEDGNPFTLHTVPEEDITLYARWERPTVAFGLMGPLTNDYAIYGNAVLQGAQLAMSEINQNGGVLGFDLEIIAYDTQGDPVLGVEAYNELVADHNMTALIGGTFSGVSLAVKELAKADGLPMITPTATHPDVTLNADNVFRACYTDIYQGKVAAMFAANDLGTSKVAVLYNRDDAYSTILANAFIDQYTSLSLSLDEYVFGMGDDDFTVQLSAIQSGDYDAVYLPAYIPQVVEILEQANTLGIDIPFIGSDGWDSIERDYAAVAEGNYFLTHYSLDDDSTLIQAFYQNYVAMFDEEPNVLSALAYDAVYAMVEAIENADSLDSLDIVLALHNLDLTTSVTGLTSFDQNGDPLKEITVVQIVDGEQVYVKKIDLS
jgi:branched-chain amino acid transport system substrate-binding protein